MLEGTHIRNATPGDEPALLHLWQRSEAEPGATDDVGSIARLIEEQPAGVLVAEVDGVIVGSILALWDGWRGNLYRLAVDPGTAAAGWRARCSKQVSGACGSEGAVGSAHS